MKRIIYTMAILFLATVASNAQYTRTFEIKNGDMPETTRIFKDGRPMSSLNVARETIVASHPSTYSNLSKMMFLNFSVTDSIEAFRTRLHPYYSNTSDTARALPSRVSEGAWYIGDVEIPNAVGDGEGGTAFIQNGVAQFVLPLTFYFPEFSDGVFEIDTIAFTPYPSPSRPVNSEFYFGIQKVNIPNLGTDSLKYILMDYQKMWKDLPTALQITADDMNSKVTDNGDGSFSIKNTIIPFTDPTMDEGWKELRKYKSNESYVLFLTKDKVEDLKDTLSVIGSWEWNLEDKYRRPYCLAAGINHYPKTNGDSIATQSSIYYTTNDKLKEAFPALDNIADKDGRIFCRRNINFLIKGRYTGTVGTSVSVVEDGSNSFELSQNYPNPVFNTTNIRFSTKEFANVTLNLYNSVGQLVHMLVAREYAPGTYDVSFDASKLPSGTYFYTMTIGSFSKTLPMTIAR